MPKTPMKLVATVLMLTVGIVAITQLQAQKPARPGFDKKGAAMAPVPGTEDAQVLVSAQIVSVPMGTPIWDEINASEAIADSVRTAILAGEVELLGEPRLLTMNGEHAGTKIGSQIPSLVREPETGTYMPSAVDVYTVIGTTPWITEDGRIVLATDVMHGQWPGYDAGPPEARYTVQPSASAAAKPTVSNGETVVLHGLCDFRLVEGEGDRPVREFHEIYVLLTPQVVDLTALPAALQELMAPDGE